MGVNTKQIFRKYHSDFVGIGSNVVIANTDIEICTGVLMHKNLHLHLKHTYVVRLSGHVS
jgi:hypothetical protein